MSQTAYPATDCTVPESLKQIQKKFGKIITTPLIDNHFSQQITFNGKSLAEEASEFIIPSPTLAAHERIQIYNQQYWWRLLKILREHYPFLTRLFGPWDFDQAIGMHYLQSYPPDSWSLYQLGEKLPLWLEKNYSDVDKTLVLTAAEIDWGYQKGFTCKHLPPLSHQNQSPEDAAALASKALKLQPSIQLFECSGHYFNFRDAFLEQEVEYWLTNDFPLLSKKGVPHYFVIYRNRHFCMDWMQIAPAQYYLLKQIEGTTNLIDACCFLENLGGEIYQDAFSHIQEWFQEWTVNQWLVAAE